MVLERRLGDWIDGRYEIYDIHTGGMGIVYVVYDHQGAAGRTVIALKTLRDEFLASDRHVQRFLTECHTWIRLERHFHLARAYSVQQIEDRPYVLMELITGGDLSQWIGTPRLDVPQVLRFGIQFCLGMEHAILKGLHCHRDIKPANLLVTEGGTLKITDFGLAKVRDEGPDEAGKSRDAIPLTDIVEVDAILDPAELESVELLSDSEDEPIPGRGEILATRPADAPDPLLDPFLPTIDWPGSPGFREAETTDWGGMPRPPAPAPAPPPESFASQRPGAPTRGSNHQEQDMTRSGQMLGTVLYSSPEQFRNARAVDSRSDMYSFGVVLYEMLAGHRPFRGRTPHDLRHQHLHETPPTLILSIPYRYQKVARRLDQIVRRCLKKKPEQRYASFADLRKDLARCLWKVARERVPIPAEIELDAWEWTSKGVSLGTLALHDEEMHCYRQALRCKPNHVPAWFNQAAVLGDLGKWQEALKATESALGLNPLSIPARINQAVVLHALGRSDEAIDGIDETIRLAPLDPEAWYRRGLLQRDREDYKGAKKSFERALELRPSFAEVIHSLDAMADSPRSPHPPGSAPGAPRWQGTTGHEPVSCVRRIEDTTGEPPVEKARSFWDRFW